MLPYTQCYYRNVPAILTLCDNTRGFVFTSGKRKAANSASGNGEEIVELVQVPQCDVPDGGTEHEGVVSHSHPQQAVRGDHHTSTGIIMKP